MSEIINFFAVILAVFAFLFFLAFIGWWKENNTIKGFSIIRLIKYLLFVPIFIFLLLLLIILEIVENTIELSENLIAEIKYRRKK